LEGSEIWKTLILAVLAVSTFELANLTLTFVCQTLNESNGQLCSLFYEMDLRFKKAQNLELDSSAEQTLLSLTL
jgi:hypothetical protein